MPQRQPRRRAADPAGAIREYGVEEQRALLAAIHMENTFVGLLSLIPTIPIVGSLESRAKKTYSTSHVRVSFGTWEYGIAA